MKNHTLSLSLLISAALTIPTLAMAAPANTKPVKKQTATAEIAVEATGSENNATADDYGNKSTKRSTANDYGNKSASRSFTKFRITND